MCVLQAIASAYMVTMTDTLRALVLALDMQVSIHFCVVFFFFFFFVAHY